MTSTFAQLGVPQNICDALERRGILEPFEIQSATIADALDGRDVCGRAPTGSGKTLAFGIPLVASVGEASPRRPRGLVLAPTRELADQINTELRTFSGDVSIDVVYGGVGYGPQKTALKRGVDVLVACPGRLEDLIEQGVVSLDEVDHVVLDEADRMADMGFMPAVRRILDQTQHDRQTILFSATLDGDVAKLTRQYQNDPVRHEVGEETPDITSASHVFWKARKEERAGLTAEAVEAVWPAIIFCRTRHGSDRLAKQLERTGLRAAAIHGGRSQNQRTRALEDFSKNRVHVLVATDVAARGIHVDGVALVVHYDPPEDHKTYVHRSGRTARAGEGGVVLSLLQGDQTRDAEKVQRKVGLNEPVVAPDVEALTELSPAEPLTLAAPIKRSEPSSGNGKSRGRNGKPRRSGGGGGRNGSGRPGSSRGGPKKGANKRKRRDEESSGSGQSRSGASRSGGRDGAGRGAPKKKARSGGSQSSNGSSGNGSNGAAGTGPKGPNRKQRRAHLQRDVSASSSSS